MVEETVELTQQPVSDKDLKDIRYLIITNAGKSQSGIPVVSHLQIKIDTNFETIGYSTSLPSSKKDQTTSLIILVDETAIKYINSFGINDKEWPSGSLIAVQETRYLGNEIPSKSERMIRPVTQEDIDAAKTKLTSLSSDKEK